MKILFASPEIVPFAKTGGLADVSGALPKALEKLGEDVTAIMPKYQAINDKKFGIEYTGKNIQVPISNRIEEAKIYKSQIPNPKSQIPVYFIDKKEYYDRPYLYGTTQGDYPDNAERFIFFDRAILETCKILGLRPDIIHCNDWQTGMIPVYLKTLYKDDQFKLFTVRRF